MGSILENASLLKKVYIPKHIFPIAKVLSSCINFLLSLPGLVILLILTKAHLKLSMLLGIIPVIYVLLFCFGIAVLLSTITVFFRDMFHLYSVFITILTYLTPLFYPKEIIPRQYMYLINMNPMFYFVNMFRKIVYYGVFPTLEDHIACIIITIISVLLGLIVFNKNKKKFIFHI